MRVLNVGGNCKSIPIPKCYDLWEHHLLDIDPKGEPDICCDARTIWSKMELEGKYDSVYCSHNLEHYYHHDVPSVLRGFYHVTNVEGFVYIAVPHILRVLNVVVQGNLEITDPLYRIGNGEPISAHDIIFGWGKEVRDSGCDFYAHKTAFTPRMLISAVNDEGFPFVYIKELPLDLQILAFKVEPTQEKIDELIAGM